MNFPCTNIYYLYRKQIWMSSAADIKVTRIDNSRFNGMDPEKLEFGRVFSDHMLVADYSGGEWTSVEIKPFGDLPMSPAMSAIHYGQAIFEGLKAHRSSNDEVLLFRPLENLKRMNLSGARFCMPEIPEWIFIDGLKKLVDMDRDWVMKGDKYSMYIRPVLYANDACVGVRVSDSYRFMIMTSPVGAYFNEPVKVLIETHYVRATEGGVGFTKAAGNYANSMYPTRLAQAKGYQQLIWTDAKTHSFIEESGMMNVMFLIDGVLVTPTTESNTILIGGTRSSLIQLAKDRGIKVEERKVSVAEIVDAFNAGKLQEAFGTGTAATVAPIKAIGHNGTDMVLPAISNSSLCLDLMHELNEIRRGRMEDRHGWNIVV